MKKQISIPTGMLLKKYYCHKCGNKLEKLSHTDTITPDDPDYSKHRHTRIGGKHFFATGNVEVTEVRNFMCPNCVTFVPYDEQRIVANVQKRLKKRVLDESEIAANREKAEVAVKRVDLLLKIAFTVAWVVVIALMIYFGIVLKNGDVSFKYYF